MTVVTKAIDATGREIDVDGIKIVVTRASDMKVIAEGGPFTCYTDGMDSGIARSFRKIYPPTGGYYITYEPVERVS